VSGKIQTIPTTAVTGYWDPGSESKVPETVKVVMADGTRAKYRLEIEQPHPCFVAAMDNIKNMKTGYAIGGVFSPDK